MPIEGVGELERLGAVARLDASLINVRNRFKTQK